MKMIACDIDSTVWNCYPLFNEAAKEIFGEGYREEEVTHWYWLKEKYGDDFWSIFDVALAQKNFSERELYDGAIENIDKLKYLGFGLKFVTHNRKPDSIRKPLKNWIESNFGDIPVSIVSSGNKNTMLERMGADVFIDDSPVHLENAKEVVKHLLAKKHPYNQQYLADNPDIISFDSWDEVPEKVFSLSEKEALLVN